MAKGLYPESHGIIGNMMYDRDNEDEFLVNKPSAFDPKWWKGEPVSGTFLLDKPPVVWWMCIVAEIGYLLDFNSYSCYNEMSQYASNEHTLIGGY